MGAERIIDELAEERYIAEQWVLYSGSDEKWLQAIKLTERTLSSKKQIFLSCRRAAAVESGKRRMNWITYTQRRYAERMGKLYKRPEEEFWPSEKTICNWWNQIIGIALHIAYHMGCSFSITVTLNKVPKMA